ncbi:hypothetical protein XENORESO_002578 [Xenotaenia resolanae]|uniref:Uncharacterized protein n=1 Tax=Xenotaenia resolanae TaxID=208358 RepID=A0ABV0VNN2_9TELE
MGKLKVKNSTTEQDLDCLLIDLCSIYIYAAVEGLKDNIKSSQILYREPGPAAEYVQNLVFHGLSMAADVALKSLLDFSPVTEAQMSFAEGTDWTQRCSQVILSKSKSSL